jgi:hypothetical protein
MRPALLLVAILLVAVPVKMAVAQAASEVHTC